MAAFVPVAHGADIAEGMTEEDSVCQLLHWAGFTAANQRNNIFNDSLGSFEDIRSMNSKDITAMSKDFSSRQAAQRIHFGVRRIKRLVGTMYFIQDFYRVSMTPSIVGLNNVSFNLRLETALARAAVREKIVEQQDTAAKAASPGPLSNERKWKE